MSAHRNLRFFLSLAIGGLLWAGLLLLRGASQAAHADPGALFVSTAGSGTACSQDQPCTLRTALARASDGDIIYVAQGIYTGTGAAVISITKSITLYGGWDGSTTTPPVRNPRVYTTTLDGQGQRRVVYISRNVSPTLEAFIITGGNATGLGGSLLGDHDAGGGVYSAQGAAPILRQNVILNNLASAYTATVAGLGGGIYLAEAPDTALVVDNQILSNTASAGWLGEGGGICIGGGEPTIANNRIEGNIASSADTGVGGGIRMVESSALVYRNGLQSNVANAGERGSGRGGGIAVSGGAPVIGGNALLRNASHLTTSGQGGGIYVSGSEGVLIGNIILHNYASTAAVDLSSPTDVRLINNMLGQNAGGGISVMGSDTAAGTAILLHNTLAYNSRFGVLASGYSVVTMTNNIVVSHTVGITTDVRTSAAIIADHTLFWQNRDDGIQGTSPVLGDPAFISPEGNFRLRPGSAAIDAGVDAGVTADIDGDPRPLGAGYDLGADEFSRYIYLYLPVLVKEL